MEDMDSCLKRPGTLTFTITDKVLIVMREVYIGLIPSSPPSIIYMILVYCCYFMFMVMREVNTGLIPATFIRITMVDYTVYTQDHLTNLFRGVCQEKMFKQVTQVVSHIHIKIIIIIIIQAYHHPLIHEFYHTLFLFFHITLLILFMNLMELHPIHMVFKLSTNEFPSFLLIHFLVHQGG